MQQKNIITTQVKPNPTKPNFYVQYTDIKTNEIKKVDLIDIFKQSQGSFTFEFKISWILDWIFKILHRLNKAVESMLSNNDLLKFEHEVKSILKDLNQLKLKTILIFKIDQLAQNQRVTIENKKTDDRFMQFRKEDEETYKKWEKEIIDDELAHLEWMEKMFQEEKQKLIQQHNDDAKELYKKIAPTTIKMFNAFVKIYKSLGASCSKPKELQ